MVLACRRMAKERVPVKARKFEIVGSKKSRSKERYKQVVKSNVMARRLTRADAQDCSLWRFGSKTGSPLLAKKQFGFQKTEKICQYFRNKWTDDNDVYNFTCYFSHSVEDCLTRKSLIAFFHQSLLDCQSLKRFFSLSIVISRFILEGCGGNSFRLRRHPRFSIHQHRLGFRASEVSNSSFQSRSSI